MQAEMIINKLTAIQASQLLQVPPSHDDVMDYRPCQVVLKNGETFDNVYVVQEDSYLQNWGVMPDEDSAKKYILIEYVVSIKESPNRLPSNLANKIYDTGESGMGYCLFKIVLDNGETIDIGSGNAVDFVPLPKGMSTKNIKDVLPHQGSRKKYLAGLKYYWCLYKNAAVLPIVK